MHPHQTPADLVDLAASHLRMAPGYGDHRSDGDPFSLWHAYAGQLDLAAGGLSTRPGITPQVADHADVITHLERAIRALDQVPPGDGPTDLALWCWQLEQLRRTAQDMAAA